VGPLHPYRGGIAHYGALLARELATRGEVDAVNFSHLYPGILFPGRTQLDHSDSPLQFEAPRLLGSYHPLSWLRTARHLADLEPDVVVFHWWHPFFGPAYGSICRRLARLRPRCKRLFLCHNVLPHEESQVDSLLCRYAFGATDGYLVHSESDAARLKGFLHGAQYRVHPHPRYDAFGGDSNEPGDREGARRELGIGSDERVALFFGYVRAYKGLDLALRALARTDDPLLKLYVVGEFYDDRAPYDEMIQELGIGDRVRIVDRYVANEEVPLWFQSADIVLQPYHSATQSGIAQIAFAFGLPVLATAVGGLPEQIAHDKTGFLVPPGDVEALAATLQRFFAQELGPAMKAEIIKADAAFSWVGLADALEKLTEEVMG
jgi:D-inositol-3-phosphate glycosyltransferase